MTHPGLETLLAHIDDELARDDGTSVAAHVTHCPACRTAVAELRETSDALGAALSAIDAIEPATWAAPAADAARPARPAADTRAAVQPLRPRTSWQSGASLRRAAAILLITAAAGSAAVIGGRAILSQRADAPEPDGAITAQGSAVAAVSVAPVNGRMSIALDRARSGSRVYVDFAHTADVAVAVAGTAPHVTAGDGRIVVDFANAVAEIRVTMPQQLRHGDITADGMLLVTVRDGRASPADASEAGIPLGSGAPIDP
jgi:anti-sigma factor RsiW